MTTSKWLVANDPHPAHSFLDEADRPKVTVRMDQIPRLYSEPVHPTPPEGRVLPKTHDGSKTAFGAATSVLVAVVIVLGWTVADLIIGGAL